MSLSHHGARPLAGSSSKSGRNPGERNGRVAFDGRAGGAGARRRSSRGSRKNRPLSYSIENSRSRSIHALGTYYVRSRRASLMPILDDYRRNPRGPTSPHILDAGRTSRAAWGVPPDALARTLTSINAGRPRAGRVPRWRHRAVLCAGVPVKSYVVSPTGVAQGQRAARIRARRRHGDPGSYVRGLHREGGLLPRRPSGTTGVGRSFQAELRGAMRLRRWPVKQ